MNQNQLVNMLKLAYCDEDRGWNNAVISILKSNVSGLDPQIVFNARTSFTLPLSFDQIKKLYTDFNDGGKLNAVKTYKDISGYGLKESKEQCDKFFQLCHDYKNQL